MINSKLTDENSKSLLPGWVRALLIIIPFIVIALLFSIIGKLLIDIPDTGNPTLLQQTIIQLFVMLGCLVLVAIFTIFIDRNSLTSIGFSIKGRTPDIVLGVALGAALMAIGFGILLLLNQITVQEINYNLPKLCLSLLLFIIVSINEEVLLRGYILNNLMQSTNKYAALIISSVLFSLLHIFNSNFNFISFINIALAGIMLGISYIYTRNLWFPIALHFSWNFFQGPIFGFNVSGHQLYSLTIQTRSQNNLINGGEFGFEGSILSLILSVITIIFIWYWFKNKR